MAGERTRTAVLSIENPPDGLVDILKPEMEFQTDRCSVGYGYEGDSFVIRLKSDDTTVLRSALSSHLRWISCALSVNQEVQTHGHT